MPPKKLPPRGGSQQAAPQAAPQQTASPQAPPNASANNNAIPPQNIKQSSATSAQLALDAAQKAYNLRQAATAAGDPDAREEILGKAINAELEAEAFGKAAKYTRSGAFQGLAAGAGLGIQPGAVIGQITGAIVGGVLSTVGGVVGGGIGSAYGAIRGPMWDVGAMASQGVRSVVGDFIGDFPELGKASRHQKDVLEKMVLGARKTRAPNQKELEEMRDDDGGVKREDYEQMAKQVAGYLPSMPDVSTMTKNMPSMPKGMPLVSSLQGLMGQKAGGDEVQQQQRPRQQATKPKENVAPKESSKQPPKPKGSTQQTSSQPTQSKSQQPSTNSGQPGNTKKAPKLEIRSDSPKTKPTPPPSKKAPPKLAPRGKSATASA